MSHPQEDCEALLAAVLPLAEQMLEQQGAFFPFGGAMKADGEIVSVGGYGEGEEPPEAEALPGILNALFMEKARAGDYRATALVTDAKVLSETDGDQEEDLTAVAVHLDHRDGYSVVVLMPYILEPGRMLTAELSAQPGENAIFGVE